MNPNLASRVRRAVATQLRALAQKIDRPSVVSQVRPVFSNYRRPTIINGRVNPGAIYRYDFSHPGRQ